MSPPYRCMGDFRVDSNPRQKLTDMLPKCRLMEEEEYEEAGGVGYLV